MTLPANVGAEKLILGSILLDSKQWALVAETLGPGEFSLEKHRRIFRRMKELHARGEEIDRVTLANELMKQGQLESVDGLGYLVSLDDGLPRICNLESYIRIVHEKATYRRLMFAAHGIMDRCAAEAEPADELAGQAEATMRKVAEGATPEKVQWVTPLEIAQRFPGGVEAFLGGARTTPGIPSPWPSYNRFTLGFHRGELTVVAGRPTCGKTCWGLQVGYWAAKHGFGAAVESLEMKGETLTQRLVSQVARIDSVRIRGGYLNEDERGRAKLALKDMPGTLKIRDQKAKTVSSLAAALRRLQSEIPVDLVVIDHCHLMTVAGSFRDRREMFSTISNELKSLALELDVAVVLLAQLNRECDTEKRPPRLSDLKETGTLEEDADVVVFIYRREMQKPKLPELKGLAQFVIAKQRNGPMATLEKAWLKEFQKFEELAEHLDDEQESLL